MYAGQHVLVQTDHTHLGISTFELNYTPVVHQTKCGPRAVKYNYFWPLCLNFEHSKLNFDLN